MAGADLAPARGETADVLRAQFGPQATDSELAYFGTVAQHLGVDPWAGHICLMPTTTAEGGRVHRPTLTVAGRRFIAERTGRLRGIVGPEWCEARRRDEKGARLPLEWLELWDGDPGEYPYAARCIVHVADWDHPVNGTARWAEFAQYRRDGRTLRAPWLKMPAHMLGKVAESLALRRAFSEVQSAVTFLGGDDAADVVAEVAAEAYATPPEPPPVSPAHPAARARAARPDAIPDFVRDQSPEGRGIA